MTEINWKIGSQPILDAAALFGSILECALEPKMIKTRSPKLVSIENTKSLLKLLPLSKTQKTDWLDIFKQSLKDENN